jgi:hypothetical protein
MARCASHLINDFSGRVRNLLVGNLDGHLIILVASLGTAVLLVLVLGAAAVVEDGDLIWTKVSPGSGRV